ncbi:MAG: site-specific integrase [candidate division Zixibacteria bacterium]
MESKEPDFLYPAEIKLILKAITPKYVSLYFTAVITRMRRGELLGLTWSDVDWSSGQIFVQRSLYKGQFTTPKSKGSHRKIVMTPALQYVLAQYRENSGTNETGLVFTSTVGTALDPDNIIKRQFHPALERAGLRRIRFHDLRHSYCAMLIGLKENIKFIQMQMGHSSATITLDRYGHLMNDDHHEFGQRLDKIMLGKSVRKLLENGGFEQIPDKKETPEVFEP